MLRTTDTMPNISYKGFKNLDSQMAELEKEFTGIDKYVGGVIGYICKVSGIDCDSYALWMHSIRDFSELVILYLSAEEKDKVRGAITELRRLCC